MFNPKTIVRPDTTALTFPYIGTPVITIPGDQPERPVSHRQAKLAWPLSGRTSPPVLPFLSILAVINGVLILNGTVIVAFMVDIPNGGNHHTIISNAPKIQVGRGCPDQ